MSSLSIASPLHRAMYAEQGAFQKEKTAKTKSFSEKRHKFLYSVCIVVRGAIAIVSTLALLILAKVAGLFKLKTLQNYSLAFYTKFNHSIEKAKSVIFNYNELVAFSSNHAPFQPKLYKSGVDTDKVFKEIHKKDFDEINKRAVHLNSAIKKDHPESTITYKCLDTLKPYEHGGYCLGATFDFAQRYFEEIAQGADEDEAVKKITGLSKDHVTSRALILQRLEIKNYLPSSDKLFLKSMQAKKNKKELIEITSGKSEKHSKSTCERIDQLQKELLEYDFLSSKLIYELPKAKLVDLKLSLRSKHLVLNKICFDIKRDEFNENRLKAAKELLNSLEKGVYKISTSSLFSGKPGHSMLLIKQKTGNYIFFDPNYGSFKFKSSEAAKKLLGSSAFGRGEVLSKPEKFKVAAFSKLEPNPVKIDK